MRERFRGSYVVTRSLIRPVVFQNLAGFGIVVWRIIVLGLGLLGLLLGRRHVFQSRRRAAALLDGRFRRGDLASVISVGLE